MDLTSWVSVFMAIIAVASTVITYVVFRSSTDPVVIVYAQPDLQRQSIINLFIENIGKGAAHSISFQTSRPIPERAFGINPPENAAQAMSSGPIVAGVPFLAPGQRISITWGQYGGLKKYLGDEPIRVDAFCYRGRRTGLFSRKLAGASTLDIDMFATSESAEHGFGPELAKQMKALNKTMTSVMRIMEESLRLEQRAED